MSEVAKQLKIWNEVHTEKNWGTCPSEHVARFVSTFLDKKAIIVELGAGRGANVKWLHGTGFENSTGVEFSEAAVANAVTPYIVNADALSFLEILGGSCLDAVIDCECLYTMEFDQYIATVRQVMRNLRYKGYFFTQTFGSRTSTDIIEKLPGFTYCCKDYELLKILREEGFSISQYQTVTRSINSGSIVEEHIVVAQKP